MSETQDYQVLMSPLLDARFQKIENDIHAIKMEYMNANKKYDTIIQLLKDNNSLQNKILEENNHISEENMKLLQENRKIYMDALEKIYETEKKELKPILQKLYENNDKLTKNINLPYFDDRLMNRMWRTSYMKGGMNNQIMGVSNTKSQYVGLNCVGTIDKQSFYQKSIERNSSGNSFYTFPFSNLFSNETKE